MNTKEKKQLGRYFNIFVWLFIILNLLDIATTWFVLNNGGIEGNPFARMMFGQMGYFGSSIVKIGLMILAISLTQFIKKHRQILGLSIIAFITGLLAAVVYSNFLIVMEIAGM